MNYGTFIKDKYIKKVRFSKAVLWKDRQISLSLAVTSKFRENGTKEVVFEDEVKKERWTAPVDVLREVKVLKRVGQEEQFYFPITAFKKEKIV